MKILFIVVTILLTGCQPSTEVKTNYKVPPELSDCKFFEMYDGSRTAIVVRCPNSSTSVSKRVSCGKSCSRDEYTMTSEGENK